MHAGISLVVVSGDSELTEGETMEMECAAGVLDANSILVLFRFNERVMALQALPECPKSLPQILDYLPQE